MFGSDWLANLFLSFFLFGLIFTVASLALGWVGGAAGGHDIHVDLPGGHDVHIDVGDVGAHAGASGADVAHAGHAHQAGPGWLNLPTIMATITWFGGVGYLLRQSLGLYGWLAALLALISGLVGGALMFLLLARVLWPMMSKPLDQRNYSLPGTSARVVSAIREGGVGEIVYSKDGARFTAGARSDDNSAIAKGAEVVIIRYERGLAYVQDIEALLERREVG
ncbi:MAG: hypothetical protein WCD37_15935 [Chloroflexia bacterium]